MNKSKKTTLKRILVVLLGIAVLVGFVIFDPSLKELEKGLMEIAPEWFACALACVLVYYIGDTLMYLIGAKIMDIPQKFGEGLLTTMIGFFYSAITPLSSGGQPFQIVQMRKRGISPGTGTSVLVLKFLGWHFAITLFGLVGMVAIGTSFISGGATMLVLFIIGVAIHAGCLALGILSSFKAQAVERAGNKVIAWLSKFLFKKRPEKIEGMYAAWHKFIYDYEAAMKVALKHKGGLAGILLVGVAEVFAYMAVTYFIYRGLGFNEAPFMEMVLMQAMLSISVAFIPLPGASVASEGGFFAIFTRYFADARSLGMLIWRGLTYYLTMLLGLIAVVIDGMRVGKVQKKDETEE